MGRYLNIGNENFRCAVNGKYVDKSGAISLFNTALNTKDKMICQTRCRRFGKSMMADMLCAYYDKSCDSRQLFRGPAIEKDPSYEKHLNKYPVIYFSISDFISRYRHDPHIVDKIQSDILKELCEEYSDVPSEPNDDIMAMLLRIKENTGQRFIMIIDEWDAITREFEDSEGVMAEYVTFLRGLFKSVNTNDVFVGAYMTGILPIPKDKTQSALNNFRQYTMTNPGQWATYFGFTKSEVVSLCETYGMDFDDLEKWYDGYRIGDEPSMFNPNSVIEAINRHKCDNYWNTTGAYDAITPYIKMNFDGLRDDVIAMLGAENRQVDIGGFNNDPKCVKSKDDALTLLIHLGYLAYNPEDKTCDIPNMEVQEEMRRAVKDSY